MYNVEAPEYPSLNSDKYFKYTTKKVEGFSGLQIRNGPYGAISEDGQSDGTVHFCCDKEMKSENFIETVEWVDKNASLILDLCLESFVDQYWEMRDLEIANLIDEGSEAVVPEISTHKELKNLVGIVAVHVKEKSEAGEYRFGIEFGCTWEDEHGAGAGFEGLKIVKSGGASDAFNF